MPSHTHPAKDLRERAECGTRRDLVVCGTRRDLVVCRGDRRSPTRPSLGWHHWVHTVSQRGEQGSKDGAALFTVRSVDCMMAFPTHAGRHTFHQVMTDTKKE